MARDFIKVDRTQSAAIKAPLILAYRDTLRRAIELGNECLATMAHMNDGTVFTDIETNFGVQAGKGQAVFNLINGSVGSFSGTFQVADAKNLTETLVG